MKEISEIIMNPVRMRIIQELATAENMTANALCERMNDVPRTTLYRHISILIDHEILSVVSEKKVRGSFERTIALNINAISKHNTIENAAQNAFGFLMSNYVKFHKYFEAPNPDPAKDRIFLNNTVLMMSDEEFDEFLKELRQVLQKNSFESAEGRKARDISIISSPVEIN